MDKKHVDRQDRHKTPRHFQSGAEKRRLKKEQQQKDAKLLAQMPKMTNFIMRKNPGAADPQARNIEVKHFIFLLLC